MLHLFNVSLTALYGFVILYLLNKIWDNINYSRKTKAFKCGEIKTYSHWDPVWGMDFVMSMSRAFKQHRWLSWMEETWAAQGTKTFKARFLGMRMVYSSEMENMKAMSTSQWEEFVLEPIRVDNGVATPFTGKGFLDTSTEFLFGRSRDSLQNPEKEDVMLAMVDIMRGARVRLTMGKFMFLHRDPKWYESIRLVHKFMNEYIDEAFDELKQRNEFPDKFVDKPERTDLLWDMAHQIEDKILLRDQITAVWVPSNETTSIHISNAIFALARHSEVWKRLQREVKDTFDESEEITFSKLRGMQYMNWVINEVHRIMPNGIQMIRVAAHDTTLPRGGGPDGKQPIFCAKGDIVHSNRYLMHRDPDYWGPDAAEFRPERWKSVRPLWHFVPFGGGPRICPAHILVATETAYVLTRFCQRFKNLEARDDRPYVPVMRVGPSSLHGVKVAVTPR
ncbi:hypothetical protein CSPX01_15105 [Colletotrichum filicis]|nr:hypothetical protein CSPX01_15105 [Colletotrichum filicis]